jgi:hypothetical protein
MKMKSTMATWKKRKLIKDTRASRTRSGKARVYFAYPPATGWPGGVDCILNGARKK